MSGRTPSERVATGVLPWLIAWPAAVVLVYAAIGRQLSFEAISPTDLAFFHQSTWSAVHGLGFAQTVLGFEGGGLLQGVHLEPVRLVLAAFYRLVPGLATLVGVQALAVALGAVPVWRMVYDGTGLKSVASLAAAGYLAHPLTLELACADLRPIVFMAPGTLVVLLAVSRRRIPGVLMGGLMVVTAREEGARLLAALLPFAAVESGRWPVRRRALASLALVAGAGFVALWLLWGRVGNLDPLQDARGIGGAILRGERPVFRNVGEAWFGLRCLAPCLLGVLVPELLLPAVGAWVMLAVFSSYEAVNAGGRGVHYLAVVHPLLVGGAGVGLVRVGRWLGLERAGEGEAVPEGGELRGGEAEGGELRGEEGEGGELRGEEGEGEAVREGGELRGGVAVAIPRGHAQAAAMRRRERVAGRARGVVLGLAGLMGVVGLSVDGAQREMVARFARVTVGPASGETAGLRRWLEPIMADDGAVLSVPATAGWLAGRPVLRVVGEFPASPQNVAKAVGEVRWAVIEARAEIGRGDMSDEAVSWERAVQGAGFERLGGAMGLNVWRRTGGLPIGHGEH